MRMRAPWWAAGSFQVRFSTRFCWWTIAPAQGWRMVSARMAVVSWWVGQPRISGTGLPRRAGGLERRVGRVGAESEVGDPLLDGVAEVEALALQLERDAAGPLADL